MAGDQLGLPFPEDDNGQMSFEDMIPNIYDQTRPPASPDFEMTMAQDDDEDEDDDDDDDVTPADERGRIATLSVIPTSTTNPKRPRTLAAGYDKKTYTLSVIFRDGTPYNYYDVSPMEWQNFRAAVSKGVFIRRYLDRHDRGFPSVVDEFTQQNINNLMAYARANQDLYEGVQHRETGHQQSMTNRKRALARKVAEYGSYTTKSGKTYRSVEEVFHRNRTRTVEKNYDEHQRALKQFYKNRRGGMRGDRPTFIWPPQIEQFDGRL